VSFEQITAIVKHRWETGDYGHAHFRVTTGVNATMRAQVPPSASRPGDAWSPPLGQLSDLMAIPVVIDDTLEAGQWKLVDNSTSEVLRVGQIDESEAAQH
jgi:hypothetical protein